MLNLPEHLGAGSGADTCFLRASQRDNMTVVPKPPAPAGASLSGSRPAATRAATPNGKTLPVVGVGASAGGLEACRKLFAALPPDSGMAFVLVQHLDPTHESLIVELLTGHTPLTVSQAADGELIAPDHLYVIPPGTYLSVAKGRLHLSTPTAPHGSRLPFDFLLASMAEDIGENAICLVLSGSGEDGSIGLKAIHAKGGFVIAQDPDEAGYGGMPRSAILTGDVDQTLALDDIPAALAHRAASPGAHVHAQASPKDDPAHDRPAKASDAMSGIVALLRSKTAHDFTLYKPGTLQRRTERRMAMSGIDSDNMDRYLDFLRHDAGELDMLASDLLINVTSFFRDPKVFAFLAEKTIPDMVANQPADLPLRLWIAGCSTGEETYSLAILFREEILRARSPVKLQIFASDVDPEAVASAREGLYADTIRADISPERLARFFAREGDSYRISPDLRGMIVFTVQDVLADPPFSRLDMVSCRNLLIYLRPEAQAHVIALFHFALRDRGILLLGSSETVGHSDGRFAVVSKAERLYRHVGRSRAGDLRFAVNPADNSPLPKRRSPDHSALRPAALADLCRRLVVETYAPAAALVNTRNECLYFLGSTDRYLAVPAGHALHDILSMARDGVRTKLRSALQQAAQDRKRVVVTGGKLRHHIAGATSGFGIDVQPITSEGEDLFLVCFIDEPGAAKTGSVPATAAEASRVAELEKELESTRAELQGAIRNLEISGEEQKAINEEALSVSEEFQSTNEEMLTSKEELQSLNQELTALNSQLQETLERQRTTSNDLQNVLYSTDLATLFLDRDLKIRFFTPATRLLFSIIPSDVGRPLSDFTSLANDAHLLEDAAQVLKKLEPVEREIEAKTGAWYVRRILPYRVPDDGVEGVVITFADITERRKISDALEAAKQEAQLANAGKSRFLAAASHDLRQPLQSLKLIHGLLGRSIQGEKALNLLGRFDDILGAISGMLNTLLDINQIEAGTVRAEPVVFPIADMLTRLRSEFAYHAQAQRLQLDVMPCSLFVESDPRLLEQMVRNLLANALKYTRTGRVLVGCRRTQDHLSIEIWDTGIGIPDRALKSIFEEYEQIDNAAHDRSRGLGLGLSIVKRLGAMLDHPVHVRSQAGKGSVFSVDVKRAQRPKDLPAAGPGHDVAGALRQGVIMVVEDDPDERDLLRIILSDDGHEVHTASDGMSALDLVKQGIRPDLIMTDFNLPKNMNGLELAGKLRQALHNPQRAEIPVIILTGDISTGTVREIASRHFLQLNKPVKMAIVTQATQHLLATLPLPAARPIILPTTTTDRQSATVFIVDDDNVFRESLTAILEADGRHVVDFDSCEAFLAAFVPGTEGCLLIDAYLPGMKGVELLQHLDAAGHQLPAVMITGNTDVSTAVLAMKAGAQDFIEKPVSADDLRMSVGRALEASHDTSKRAAWKKAAVDHLTSLTARQRQVMDRVLAGEASKNIAADLGISQRTVENHRNAIMKRTGSKSLPALARLALTASDSRDET